MYQIFVIFAICIALAYFSMQINKERFDLDVKMKNVTESESKTLGELVMEAHSRCGCDKRKG